MKWFKLPCITLITITILFGAVLMASAGTVPTTLNYQGTLYDNTGQAVNGPKDITVSLYDVSSGGTAFWTELQTGVIVKDGIFSLVLGKDSNNSIDPIKLSGTTFIGIKVGSDAEMAPRQQFTSVAYAMKSGDGVPIGAIIMWSGAINQIPQGWALCDGTNGTPNLKDRFIVGAGNNYLPGTTGGNATISLQHSHIINDHTHSGTTQGPSSYNNDIEEGSGHTAADNGHTHKFATGGASDRNTDSRLSVAQDIRPPYYALAFIMKLQ